MFILKIYTFLLDSQTVGQFPLVVVLQVGSAQAKTSLVILFQVGSLLVLTE